ncbi:MAG: cation:proton antiporter [Alphaproteobacteria bacterium]
MPAHAELTALAVVALIAFACGIAMTRLRQPAIVGYILAGVLLGPSVLALVENREQVTLLAELGVLMLLYLVGMELNIRDLIQAWRTALIATLLQIGASVGVMLVLSQAFGWPPELAVLLGFVVAISSTAVAIKMLEDIGELTTPVGRLTVGVLIAQDLAVVPMMLIILTLAGDDFGVIDVGKILLSIGFVALLIWYLSRREGVRLPFFRWVASDVHLAPVAGLTGCFGAAALSGLIGLSPAYGAFLAGLIIGNSTEREVMIQSTRPIQSVLMMVFFLSIGLLIDFRFIWDNLGEVLLLLLVVTVLKTALNVGILRALRQPWPRAFLSGVLLAQIGEFSFLLADTGTAVGLIGADNYRLVIAVTVLSLATSPFWLGSARRLHRIAMLGVTSGREILRLLYGSEAQIVLLASDRAARGLYAGARAIGTRVERIRKTRRKATDIQPAPVNQTSDSPPTKATPEPGQEPGQAPEVGPQPPADSQALEPPAEKAGAAKEPKPGAARDKPAWRRAPQGTKK